MYLEGIVKVFVLEKPILLEKEKQFELQHEYYFQKCRGFLLSYDCKLLLECISYLSSIREKGRYFTQ